MTLKKFKNKTRRKTTNELTHQLINLNIIYYTSLKHYISVTPVNKEEDEKFIIILQRKIKYTSETLTTKLEYEHHNHKIRRK